MDSSVDLTLAEYQRRAQLTDRLPSAGVAEIDPKLAPLLGLVGEIGTLIAEYKKHLRDGTAYELFEDNVEEDLGDILWYLASTATRFDLSLERVAHNNLRKISDRWGEGSGTARREYISDDWFDSDSPPDEQLPREFEVEIRSVEDDSASESKVEVVWNHRTVADRLGDNTYDDTGYRFHDVFHLANAAVLGWSPVARAKIFDKKRKSDPKTDAVEDGGRAVVIEEAIAAYMFAYARDHKFLDGVTSLDFHALKTFRAFTTGLEVHARPLWQVEDAILQGVTAWRQLRRHGSGILRGSLIRHSLEYLPLEGE